MSGSPCRHGNEGSAPRRSLVLDIETAPDEHAQVLARRRSAAPRGSPIHEVVAASILTFVERPDGSIGGFELASWHRTECREPDILANVEAKLIPVLETGGRVVTFNGANHDLPMLRIRELRWWMVSADAVSRIQAGEVRHMDVMLELSSGGEARWPSLADACAGVGFSLLGPGGVGPRTAAPYEIEKCELDVLGTAILMHYLLAAERRSIEPLRRGLPALGRFIRAAACTRPHFERFALSRLLADDATAWGAAQGRRQPERWIAPSRWRAAMARSPS